jgi:hypothetical protein
MSKGESRSAGAVLFMRQCKKNPALCDRGWVPPNRETRRALAAEGRKSGGKRKKRSGKK